MNLSTRIFLFYIALNDTEKKAFKSIIGVNNFDRIRAQVDLSPIKNLVSETPTSATPQKASIGEDYDIAIMQVVRHMVNTSESNIELAKSIEDIMGKSITRQPKRSKYELQGMLLEALINAPEDKLIRIRNKLANKIPKNKHPDTQTNLDKWFSIILGKRNE
jgi:hypothetical protein